jgi:ribonuclease VapC
MVLDTSALMAVVLDAPEADACKVAIEHEPELVISGGTLAELLVVARRRGVGPTMERLLSTLAPEIIAVTEPEAYRVADAYDQWGRGVHRAALNFGDCFAYALAKHRDCPLLFVGDDFARTDLSSALG